jgi:hypothetical protein
MLVDQISSDPGKRHTIGSPVFLLASLPVDDTVVG